jgi:hypothetical protein
MPPLRSRFSAGDGIIVLAALCLIIAAAAASGMGEAEACSLELRAQEGKWRYELPAPAGRRLVLAGSAGPFVVVISNSTVNIEETHCPEKSCARMGPLTKAGDVILCLPQKIELTLISQGGKEPEVDSVCY